MPTRSRYLRRVHVDNFVALLCDRGPYAGGRGASLPLDGAHTASHRKLLLERGGFQATFPFPRRVIASANCFRNAVSAGIQLPTAGDQAQAIAKLAKSLRGWESAPNPARCYRLREDLYHRKRDPRDRPAHSRHLSQQDAGGAAPAPSSNNSSHVTRSKYFCQLFRLLPAGKPTSRAPDTYIEKDSSINRRDRALAFVSHECAAEPARDVIVVASVFLHLRHHFAGEIMNGCC